MTSGPWLEVAPVALGDVSIIPESADADGRGHNVALWAVSDKGDVLCRLGVSELNPAVSAGLLAVRVVRLEQSSGHQDSCLRALPRPAQHGSPGWEDVLYNPHEAGSAQDEVAMETRHLSRPRRKEAGAGPR